MYKVKGSVTIDFEYGVDADSQKEAMELAHYFLNDDFHIGDGLDYRVKYTLVRKEADDE